MMSVVYTIGYEGTTIERFLATLLAARVDTLVDVRELPLSRKKGFSKNSLEELIGEAGISYIHMRDLGDPRKGRDAAKSGDFRKFRQIYLSHFHSKRAQKAFEALVSLGSTNTLCMMCFERDPRTCHRHIIAQRMKVRGFAITDLFADELSRHERPLSELPSRYLGESAAATE
jgi:uncharacterized protein (DUF488 family)